MASDSCSHHSFDATNQKVRIHMRSLALGDSLAWLPVIDAFREQHQCEIHVPLPAHLEPLYRDSYPHFHIATEAEPDRNRTIRTTRRITSVYSSRSRNAIINPPIRA